MSVPSYPAQSGAEPRRILTRLASSAFTPSFSWLPDSRRVLIAVEPAPDAPRQLWMADTADERFWPVTVGTSSQGGPAVSPDGRKVAFTTTMRDRPRRGASRRQAPPKASRDRPHRDDARMVAGIGAAGLRQQPHGPDVDLDQERARGVGAARRHACGLPRGRDARLHDSSFAPDGSRIAYVWIRMVFEVD